jgi:phosphonopyruvate decarboxylase
LDAKDFLAGLTRLNVAFYTGVPDSLLKPLNDALLRDFGLTGAHVVAADEGGAVGLAAGHYIATGNPAMVYMQNSGLGNAVNPICSLLHPKVYGIPCVFVVGWRGEPGVADEPQHAFQGTVTREMLELMGITVFTLSADTDAAAFSAMLAQAAPKLDAGGSVAFVVRKGGLTGGAKEQPDSRYPMTREEALRELLSTMGGNEYTVATTGKTAREVYELREALGQGHAHDFLTVGSMGHAGMIALGMAKARPKDVFWCLDGDGAALMHLGGLAVEAQQGCRNLIHVLLNNGAHESVGGMPVAGGGLRFAPLARALGYEAVFTVHDMAELTAALAEVRAAAGTRLCFLEILLAQGSRAGLGRPAQTPRDNLLALMSNLQGEA